MKWIRFLLLMIGVLGGGRAGTAGAQAVSADSAPPPAFSLLEVRRFAVAFAVGGVAYTIDDDARRAVQRSTVQDSRFAQHLNGFGNRWGQPGVFALSALMWGGGYLADKPTVSASGLRALETLFISGLVTQAIKETAGRARPPVTTNGRNDWQLFRGYRTAGGNYHAMASGHATAAFAFATAVTNEVAIRRPEHERWVGIATYSAATLTAYARMHSDRHWLSDVTVGAGIGIVTGHAITRWHATRPGNGIDRRLLRPEIGVGPRGETQFGLSMEWPR